MKSTPQTLEVHTVISEEFSQNCYVVHLPSSRECLVIDPGFDSENVLQLLRSKGLRPAAILNTHGHLDHIAGNSVVKGVYPDALLMIGHGDASKLASPSENLSEGYGIPFTSPPADRLLQHGETVELAGIRLEVRDAPGHSSGHIVLVWHDDRQPLVFGGDVLFAGGVGRTDFPGCSMEQLVRSIHEQLFTLDDDAIVYPGHGPSTRVGVEKRENPYCGLDAR